MGFFSTNKELKEEIDRLRAELQAKSLMIEELKSKISRYSLFDIPISKEETEEQRQKYNKTAYLKRKNKQKEKEAEREKQKHYSKEVCLTPSNSFMSKEQYLRQQAQIRGIGI